VVVGLNYELSVSELAAALVGDVFLVRGVASLRAEQLSRVGVRLQLDSHRPHVAAITDHILEAVSERGVVLEEHGLKPGGPVTSSVRVMAHDPAIDRVFSELGGRRDYRRAFRSEGSEWGSGQESGTTGRHGPRGA
jgi:hypothetical protein